MSEIRDRDEFVLTVNRLMICAMEDIDCGRNEAGPTTLDLVKRIEDHDAALREALAAAERERDRLRNEVDCVAQQVIDWSKRAGEAERERDEARRTVKALTPAANYCLEYKPLLLKAERERDDAVRVLRDIATFGWYAKGAKVARAYLAAREGR